MEKEYQISLNFALIYHQIMQKTPAMLNGEILICKYGSSISGGIRPQISQITQIWFLKSAKSVSSTIPSPITG